MERCIWKTTDVTAKTIKIKQIWKIYFENLLVDEEEYILNAGTEVEGRGEVDNLTLEEIKEIKAKSRNRKEADSDNIDMEYNTEEMNYTKRYTNS